jgi:hypothetical protein
MNEQSLREKPKWNWIALWWFFVVSLCGATIAAHTMGRRVLEMLSQHADRPEMRDNVALIREQFEIITTVASVAALLVSAFLIAKLYGPLRKK